MEQPIEKIQNFKANANFDKTPWAKLWLCTSCLSAYRWQFMFYVDSTQERDPTNTAWKNHDILELNANLAIL